MGSLSVFRVALHQTSQLEQHDGADGFPGGGHGGQHGGGQGIAGEGGCGFGEGASELEG
jgi:hypothetical protein